MKREHPFSEHGQTLVVRGTLPFSGTARRVSLETLPPDTDRVKQQVDALTDYFMGDRVVLRVAEVSRHAYASARLATTVHQAPSPTTAEFAAVQSFATKLSVHVSHAKYVDWLGRLANSIAALNTRKMVFLERAFEALAREQEVLRERLNAAERTSATLAARDRAALLIDESLVRVGLEASVSAAAREVALAVTPEYVWDDHTIILSCSAKDSDAVAERMLSFYESLARRVSASLVQQINFVVSVQDAEVGD